MSATEVKLFGRWSYDDVNVADLSLVDYIAVNKAAPFLSEEARLHAFKRWQSLVQDELVVERFGEEELLRPSLGLKFVEFTELVKSKKGARCNVK